MAAKNKSYAASRQREQTERLRTILKELPEFCFLFFIAIEPQTSILTRVNYAYDLRTFFRYLIQDRLSERSSILEITQKDMDKVTSTDIERFLEYLNYYESEGGKEFENHEHGKSRKLSALRTFFKYLFKKGLISSNVAALVDMPKTHERAIMRLDVDEVARILDLAESGEDLSKRQRRFHQYTRLRDVAMLTLFLGTGIRISECVGLNTFDVNFESNAFVITRKGGQQSTLYFWTEIETALKAYLAQRKKIEALPGHEDALFLSLQKRRISVRAVQELVKKYASIAAPLKKISPHKLRSTYGTALYQQTGDIYLVADVLGHRDVNTTRKHYAAMNEDKRRLAARAITLRDDEPSES